MIRLGLRPNSSGGISEPRRLLVPLPGTREPFLLPVGVTSLMTSIFGVSGALISGTFGCVHRKDDQYARISMCERDKRFEHGSIPHRPGRCRVSTNLSRFDKIYQWSTRLKIPVGGTKRGNTLIVIKKKERSAMSLPKHRGSNLPGIGRAKVSAVHGDQRTRS